LYNLRKPYPVRSAAAASSHSVTKRWPAPVRSLPAS